MKNSHAPNSSPSPKLHIPFSELLKSVPEFFGVRLNEEPKYEVLKHEGAFEIRQYGPQLRASLTIPGLAFDEFRSRAFERLAAYIFGGNELQQTISMTSPVLQQQDLTLDSPIMHHPNAGAWTMTFVLPAKFTRANAPQPMDGQVKLEECSPYVAAVASYAGNNSLEKIKEQQAKLGYWAGTQNEYTSSGEFFTAQYDAPFVLPFLKRNEIQVKLERR